jgi:hypothetical protein
VDVADGDGDEENAVDMARRAHDVMTLLPLPVVETKGREEKEATKPIVMIRFNRCHQLSMSLM